MKKNGSAEIIRFDGKRTIGDMLDEMKSKDLKICVTAGFNEDGMFFIGCDSDSSRADMCYMLDLIKNDIMFGEK